MTKDFAKMTYKELRKAEAEAELIGYSDFAKFCITLKDYRFTDKNGKQLDK